MKAYAIVISMHSISEAGYETLRNSSTAVNNPFTPEKFDAVTPKIVENLLKDLNIKWTWPHTGSVFDHDSGIFKHGYGGKDPLRRKACGMSHYLLWKKCAEENEPFLIFEHDAIFTCRLDPEPLLQSRFDIIGLNNPNGATRLPHKFDAIVKASTEEILPVPEIDRNEVAQGLAGNSAYLIKPKGAVKLLELVKKHGMWNNDAIMCKQLMPNMLGVTKTYYTSTQRLPSTTMG